MIRFDIEVSMKCGGFDAESAEDAKQCIIEALSHLGYGISYTDVDWDIKVKPSPYQGD